MASKSDKIPEKIKALSFEDALAALEDIVQKLEAGEVGLEESIEIYTRGTQLKRHCREKLKTAEARIEKIRLAEDGSVEGVEPFDGQ